jgi:hypothetical protein
MELKQELQKIDSLQPEESGISLVGPDYVIQDRIKKYRDEEMHKHETICNEEIQLIAGRFNSLKQQCEDRINQARLNYQNCWRIWQEETD